MCLRASSWMLWAALGRPPGLPLDAYLKWSANHADPVLFSAISMWYLDTPRAVLAQVGNASPRTDANVLASPLLHRDHAHGRPGVPLAQGVFCILITISTSSYINTITLGQWDSRTVVGYQGLIRPGVPLIRGGRPMAEGCPWIAAPASTPLEPSSTPPLCSGQPASTARQACR